jgi:leucyl aminopeptidase
MILLGEDEKPSGHFALDALTNALAIADFKGKSGLVDLISFDGLDRLLVAGIGKRAELNGNALVKLGGALYSKIPASIKSLTIMADAFTPDQAADFALGFRLKQYNFTQYKTTLKDEDKARELSLTFITQEGTQEAFTSREAIAKGIDSAREVINLPPNVLNPIEFARRAKALEALGVEVEILDEDAMFKLKMGSLLGVGLGSDNESRLAVMRWNGGVKGEAPLGFIGKGVTFDTGGISLKPGAGMEDMKGDMAGAACVLGLMETLARRKAKANVIGLIGLVENMPDGKAIRPGDILTSMSGQTIEIINTDAEGRLVLADVLHYANVTYKPKFMVNLATLTGAILVALGKENAGLFSNNDDLSTKLFTSGVATGETVWRLPLSKAYDKIIDSQFADMKNSGGRDAGSITAAQFLQRFVGETPWAHLDIAGTGMGVKPSDINRSWGPGWGVRLLNHLVEVNYEPK